MKKRIISVFCAASVLISVCGCGATVNTDTSTAETEPVPVVTDAGIEAKTFEPTADNVKLLGRACYTDTDGDESGELICAYSGTGIEFTFHGNFGGYSFKGRQCRKKRQQGQCRKICRVCKR